MGEETQEEKQPAGDSIDLTQYKVKVDHFQGIHILKDEGFLEGAPNFRQVSQHDETRSVCDCLSFRWPASLSLAVPSPLRRALTPSWIGFLEVLEGRR